MSEYAGMTIWKFPLAMGRQQTIRMPGVSKALYVATQRDQPCLWCEVRPESAKIDRTFWMIGTGTPLPEEPRRYVGSFQMHKGQYIFHLYETAGA